MHYEGMIIRPPSEAYSLLLQVTVGCSHNRCTFCATYKGTKFRIKAREIVAADIREAARRYGSVAKVFLCDGDALIVPQRRLVEILTEIRMQLPGVERVGTYANAKSILRKSPEELAALRELGLGIVYLGVETGDEELLARIHKGATYEQLVTAARRVRTAGITLSVTVLLGIGGVEESPAHAAATARILTDMDPDYASALTLMVVPGTSLWEDQQAGRFILPDTFGFLAELGTIVAGADFTDCYFTSNHASNYLPIRARLPRDKEEAVRLIAQVVEKGDRSRLRPEFLRGL
jgi:radical SAM superfamily enzyme YgiQ (UPF0313 family)